MPALIDNDSAVNTRQLVESHVAESFGHHRPTSLDDSNQLSSFCLIPGHEVIDTNVRFLGVVPVDNHCEYRLLVDTGIVQFTLQKRYSQFRDLRQQIMIDGGVIGEKPCTGKCRNGACLQLVSQLMRMKFPRRKLQLKFQRDDDTRTARERQTQLQNFLDTALGVYRTAPKRQVRCCINSQCRILNAIRSFIDINTDQLSEWKAASNEVVSPMPTTPMSSPSRSSISKAATGPTTTREDVRPVHAA